MCELRFYHITQFLSYFKDQTSQSINFAILVDGIECNRYNKDSNTGPSYSCNKIGQNVTIRRWDTEVFSVCNIQVYQGECYTFPYYLIQHFFHNVKMLDLTAVFEPYMFFQV